MPSWYRWTLVVIATLLLCSCRAPIVSRQANLAPVIAGKSNLRAELDVPTSEDSLDALLQPTEVDISQDKLPPVVRRNELGDLDVTLIGKTPPVLQAPIQNKAESSPKTERTAKNVEPTTQPRDLAAETEVKQTINPSKKAKSLPKPSTTLTQSGKTNEADGTTSIEAARQQTADIQDAQLSAEIVEALPRLPVKTPSDNSVKAPIKKGTPRSHHSKAVLPASTSAKTKVWVWYGPRKPNLRGRTASRSAGMKNERKPHSDSNQSSLVGAAQRRLDHKDAAAQTAFQAAGGNLAAGEDLESALLAETADLWPDPIDPNLVTAPAKQPESNPRPTVDAVARRKEILTQLVSPDGELQIEFSPPPEFTPQTPIEPILAEPRPPVAKNALDVQSAPATHPIPAVPPPAAVAVPCEPQVPRWQLYPDEYLCDGGDGQFEAKVREDWTVRNLETEDTIGHYDTLDGRVLVEPSNRVCIYAPRFAAVRKVVATRENEGFLRPLVTDRPDGPIIEKALAIDDQVSQHEAAQRHLLVEQAALFRDRLPGVELGAREALALFVRDFSAHEDFHVIRWGTHKQSEKARLAEFTQAAVTWSHDTAVQIILDDEEAIERITVQDMESVYQVKPGKPKLRVVKTASSGDAKPGEIVEFTLRFDNVGQQVVGNVTIMDNLTTRLEYVPDSAQCSVDAEFMTEENEAESLTLRWEIKDPLEAGKGGIIRFKCRVR